jgi:hypothetical protein
MIGNSIAGFLETGVAVSASSYESIATFTPTSGTSITFSSISSTYSSLQLRMNIMGAAGAGIYYQFNGDSSTSNYTWHVLEGDGTSAAATAGTTDGYSLLNFNTSKPSTTAPFVSILDILNYASTTKNKTSRGFTGSNINTTSTAYGVTLSSGLWINTAAVTNINIATIGNLVQYSQLALYGAK